MLDAFYIFTQGGVVLWSYTFIKLKGNPINKLVEEIFLKHRMNEPIYSLNSYSIRWMMNNEHDLIYAVIFSDALSSVFASTLLKKVNRTFIKHVRAPPELIRFRYPVLDFDDVFLGIVKGLQAEEARPVVMRQFSDTQKGLKMKAKPKPDKRGDAERGLDHSEQLQEKDVSGMYMSQTEQADELEVPSTENSVFLDKLTEIVTSIGKRKMTPEVLDSILAEFARHITARNVAVEVAERVVQSVRAPLEGLQTGVFMTVRSVVRDALTTSITQVLTPTEPINILASVQNAKLEGRVYSIVFVGVNGVGKSTNLAKVAHMLKKNGYRVLIAACDTFRSGAVEQLRTHAVALEVDLYEQGYGKDSAAIAKYALRHAVTEAHDVVLIDTAGRMQDNEPLMTALGKLIKNNNPDLILFVGEALVGNDAIDQLAKFNSSLVDQADRSIDGIILTKFDTVGQCVGATISMVHLSGKPIVYIGTGQRYMDLKTPKPEDIANMLTK